MAVPDLPFCPSNPWVAEHHQRAHLAMGWEDCEPDDLVLVSDVDEIPRASRLKEMAARCRDAIKLRLHHHAFHLNARRSESWLGPVLARFGMIVDRRLTGQQVRDLALSRRGAVVSDAGWHFSWLGGAEGVVRKANSFSHSDVCRATTPRAARRWVEEGVWGFPGPAQGEELEYLPLALGEFPDYLVENRARFAHLLRYC